MKIPQNVPEPGFYYHYKHDPAGPINLAAYELVTVGVHSEDDCKPEDANMVIYRPLYDSSAIYKAGKFYWIRPLNMWSETITKGRKTFTRFQKITDPKVITELEKIRDSIYK